MNQNKMIYQSKRLSLYDHCKTSNPCGEITLEEFFDAIRSPLNAKSIIEYRQLLKIDEEKAKVFKSGSISAITYAGIFTKRNNANLTAPSSIVILDIDDIESDEKL